LSQPTLGPSPSDASGTIIAFEDPSCPSCARFELGTFPQLKSELIDQGHLSFVYRGIPVVYPWGEPAVLALEATYSLDEAVFWALKDFYYRSQNQIDGQNVRSATRQFLADETSVEAETVIEAIDQATHRDAVDTDLQASREAGVRGTPTFFLFKDGSFVTDVVGPQPYEVFKNSLGL
jgi:protein-disulfide isomerase